LAYEWGDGGSLRDQRLSEEDVLKALVHVAWGFVVEQVNVAKVGKRRVGGRVIKVVDEATTEVVVKWPRNWKELAATLMESLVVAREKLEKLKRFMRVLKWWRASDVDDVWISQILRRV
jgi:hypothetical protein